MTDRPATAWFEDVDLDDAAAVRAALDRSSDGAPADWPARAVAAGVAEDPADYYDRLHDATVAATREAVRERERADDVQLKHAVRALDDLSRVTNEIAERADEWAGDRTPPGETPVERVRALADEFDRFDGDDRDPDAEVGGSDGAPDPLAASLRSLARRVEALATERDDLRATVEGTAPAAAPNLAALAGPVLAARLIALAGDLESLARMPSGTVQVLGAEDALFAHLRGSAPSPKHGVIYAHEYVRGTRPEQRGSAARAVAGKLAIAARVDHYAGDRRPELDRELDERIERIRAREDE